MSKELRKKKFYFAVFVLIKNMDTFVIRKNPGLYFSLSVLKCQPVGVPGWLIQLSIRLRLRSWSHGSVHEFQPHIRLCTDSSEPGACFGFCVSLSLSVLPPVALCLSLSKNKYTLKCFLKRKKEKKWKNFKYFISKKVRLLHKKNFFKTNIK